MATKRALLLIADIGGYTEYMQFHRSILGHAEAATGRMLAKVVDAARDFNLVEIEGDAAFLFRAAENLDGSAGFSSVTRAVVAMHRAFHEERRLVQLNLCPCGSCTRTDELKLKFVAHVGEVAQQKIKHRKKLVGVDVIHVHRLLKNPVQYPEYLLVSGDLYRDGAAAGEPSMEEVDLELEGIGNVRSYYLDIDKIAVPPRDPSWSRRIGATFAMVGRGLPHLRDQRRRRSPASTT